MACDKPQFNKHSQFNNNITHFLLLIIILFEINMIVLLNLFVTFKIQLNFSGLNNNNISIKSIIIVLKG